MSLIIFKDKKVNRRMFTSEKHLDNLIYNMDYDGVSMSFVNKEGRLEVHKELRSNKYDNSFIDRVVKKLHDIDHEGTDILFNFISKRDFEFLRGPTADNSSWVNYFTPSKRDIDPICLDSSSFPIMLENDYRNNKIKFIMTVDISYMEGLMSNKKAFVDEFESYIKDYHKSCSEAFNNYVRKKYDNYSTTEMLATLAQVFTKTDEFNLVIKKQDLYDLPFTNPVIGFLVEYGIPAVIMTDQGHITINEKHFKLIDKGIFASTSLPVPVDYEVQDEATDLQSFLVNKIPLIIKMMEDGLLHIKLNGILYEFNNRIDYDSNSISVKSTVNKNVIEWIFFDSIIQDLEFHKETIVFVPVL